MRSFQSLFVRFNTRTIPRVYTRRNAFSSLKERLRRPKENFPIVRLKNDDNKAVIYVIGATGTKESCRIVKSVFDEVRPETIFVQTDETRGKFLFDDTMTRQQLMLAVKDLPTYARMIVDTWDQGPFAMFIRLEDMKTALLEAPKLSSHGDLILGDVPWEQTTKNLWKSFTFWYYLKTYFMQELPSRELREAISRINGTTDDFNKKQEMLREREVVRIFNNWKLKNNPTHFKILVQDRTDHMLNILKGLKGRVVAVVNMPHLDGIEQGWRTREIGTASSVQPGTFAALQMTQ